LRIICQRDVADQSFLDKRNGQGNASGDANQISPFQDFVMMTTKVKTYRDIFQQLEFVLELVL